MRDEIQDTREYYDRNAREKGATAQSVGHGNEAKQRFRYETIAKLLDTADSPITVNDYGAGYGGLFEFLANHTEYEIKEYNGYDVSEEMVRLARERVDDPKAEFYNKDTVTRQADYTVACMTFYDSHGSSDEEWTRFMKQQLRTMFKKSNLGIVFNGLTTAVDYEEDQLYYADPSEFLDFCLTELSDNIVLLHDYDLYEWTMGVFSSASNELTE